MIKVAIVDDHALVRSGFRAILAQYADMEVVGEGGSGEEAIRIARASKPDVMLLDVNLPGMSGLEATERIVGSRLGPHIIAVTVQEQQPFPRRLLEAGARGYLTKGCAAEELVRAVREVARGGRYLSHAVAHAMALEAVTGGGTSPFEQLSPRELEVALALARGDTMKQIAERLHISAKTVATHKYRVYEKLEIDSEVALAHLAVRWGLIEGGQARTS